MASESETTPRNTEVITQSTPTSQVYLRPTQFEAPPAYTPYCSANSLFHTERQIIFIQFTKAERKALRILALISIILGVVNIFVSILAIVFGTLLYCTGTGLWGGLTSTLTGIFCLALAFRRNSRCQIKSLLFFSITTVFACLVSIALSVTGTANNVDLCCAKNIMERITGNRICDFTASQIANTISTCLTFGQTIVVVMITAFFAKYSSSCCHDEHESGEFNSLSGISANPRRSNYSVFL